MSLAQPSQQEESQHTPVEQGNPSQVQQSETHTDSQQVKPEETSQQQTSDPSVANTQNADQGQTQNQNNQMAFTQPKFKYPNDDKAVWGPAWWTVMHQVASQFPDIPTRADRLEYGTWYKFMIKSLPCQDPCRINSYNYLNSNPLKFKDKNTLFESTVKFHNHVNEMTGKSERYDYRQLLGTYKDSENCPGCKLGEHSPEQHAEATATSIQSVQQNQNLPPLPTHDVDNISNQMQVLKDTWQAISNEVCTKAGVTPAKITFNKCPDNSGTSCITDTGEIYVDPMSAKFTSPFHEIDHYIDQKKGIKTNDTMNPKAQHYAEGMISQYFPYDRPNENAQNKQITHESARVIKKKKKFTHDPGPEMARTPPAEMGGVQSTPLGQNKYQALVQDVYAQPAYAGQGQINDFPQFTSAMQEIQKEEIAEKVIHHEQTKGVLSHFDVIYQYPAGLLGVHASDLNMVHTPQIISNSVMTIIESFTTPAASTILSVVSGLLIMFLGLVLKDKIPVRDQLFMQNMGGQFFWEVLRALNPKKLWKLKHELENIQSDMNEGKFSYKSLIETHDSLKKDAEEQNMTLLSQNEGEAPVMVPNNQIGSPSNQGGMPPYDAYPAYGSAGRSSGLSSGSTQSSVFNPVGREQLHSFAGRNTIRLQPYRTVSHYY